MLCHIPQAVPSISFLLHDLGRPPPAAVARALGVSTRTVQRWIADDDAPRVALLSLFWVTRWGRSQVDCQAVNDAAMWSNIAAVQSGTIAALRADVARLQAMPDLWGAANGPVWAAR